MTIYEQAKKNIVTEEMEKAAVYEGCSTKEVLEKIKKGVAVLPRNKKHNLLTPRVIGKDFKVKVNVNIGTSKDYSTHEKEMEKAMLSFKYNTDAIMILSTWGELGEMRRDLVKRSPVPVGSVPLYDAAVKSYKEDKKVIDFSEKDFIKMVEDHAEDGIDFMTIHAGVTNAVLKKIEKSKRILKVVSRGGSIVSGWMLKNNKENPFYSNYDDILSIAREYDITLSLGDGMRPGAVVDGTDAQQLEELFELGDLVLRAREAGVQVMVEGPGHLSLNQIQMNIEIAKKITHNAPFFVLGPLVTDCAPGYDHIVSAIGGSLAGFYGADFLCYVTPAEHVSLPALEDVKQGLIVSKIAAQVADVAKGHPMALVKEKKMAQYRKEFNWDKQMPLTVDNGELLKKYKENRPFSGDGCSMCGPFCAIRISDESFKKK